MTVSLADLLGPGIAAADAPPARPKRAPRAKATPAPAAPPEEWSLVALEDLPETAAGVRAHAIKMAGSGRAWIEAGVLRLPVSKNFLAQIFQMDPATVTKRLLTCPTAGMAGGGRPVYDFRTAIGYFVPPRMSIDDYIASIDPSELPPHLNRFIIGAKREALRYALEAGDAWLTADIIDTLGDLWMTIKNQMPLLVESMRELGLDDIQADALRAKLDAFQARLHAGLVEMPKKKKTLSMLGQAPVAAPIDAVGGEGDDGPAVTA
jgi:hypothetical protein